MPEHLICPRCGSTNPVGSEFCANCGWAPSPPGQQQPSQQQPQQGPYGQPQYGQPQYGQPQYGQPQYGQPEFRQPQYGQPPGTPPYAQPPGSGVAPGSTSGSNRLLFILVPAALVLALVIVLGVVFVPRLLHRDSAGPVAPPATAPQPTMGTQVPSPTASGSPSAAPSSTTPPDYQKLGPQVSSGILKIIASGCQNGGSRVGSAFLINKHTAVAALSSLAGAKVIGLSDGARTVPATVSAADPAHGVVILELDRPTSGHVFTLDNATFHTGDPVGSYGVPIKETRPGLVQTKINSGSAEAVIAGTAVTGLADTGSRVDAGMSGAPTLAANGHANGMVLLDSSDAMLIVPGKAIRAAIKEGSGSLPGASCALTVGPDATVINGPAGRRVQPMLQQYFGGINSGDYPTAFGQLSQRLQAGGYRSYAEGWATSYDFNIVVHKATAHTAHITFDSIFEKGKGPKGSGTCARWDIDYQFVTEGGGPVIDKAEPHSGSIWRKC